MNLAKRLSIVPIIIIVAVIVFTAGQGLVRAQQTPGQGIEISPPLIELNVDPGQTTSFDIRLRNVTTGTLLTKGSVEDFVAEGEEGKPKLLLDKNAEPSPYTFKPWVKSIPDLTLVSQEAKTSKVTLNVPKDAAPGGHYGVIRFSALPPELEGSGVSLSASIGTLVLINVSGDATKKATLAEFYAAQNGKKNSFFEQGPITFVERIRNEGNVHFKPVGTLRVTNMFGKEVKVLSVNERSGSILPGSVRRFEQQLDKKQLFGRYKVEANIQYSGQSLSGNLSFWVIPYKLIAICLGILILLILGLRTGLKRYNRFIIGKAGDQKTKKKK